LKNLKHRRCIGKEMCTSRTTEGWRSRNASYQRGTKGERGKLEKKKKM